jgi:hypothetical protein
MGTDVILKYKGEEIANLGRAYHFKSQPSIDDVVDKLMRRLIYLVGYTPASWEEGQVICRDIEVLLNEATETLVDIGRMYLLEMINENDNITIENE